MEFNGFEIYPCGNAVLTIDSKNILTVSGISDSGLDGVLIKIENTDSYAVNFGTLKSIPQNYGVLKSATLVKNPLGHVVSFCETFHWFDAANQQIVVGYNASLLPASYSLFGRLNGQDVFVISKADLISSPDKNFPPATLPQPAQPPEDFWAILIAAAAVAVTVWATLHSGDTTTVTRHYDADGNLTGTDVTTTHDPIPFPIQVNGKTYIVTEYGIRYNSVLPPELIGYTSMQPFPVGQQITGNGLSSFQITSIQSL